MFARHWEEALGKATVLAESRDVREVGDDSVKGLDLSPADRRELTTHIGQAIANLLAIVAYLTAIGLIGLAGPILGLVATLLYIYWRLTGGLDD